MGQRRKAREAVLESLYCWEIRGDVDPKEIFPFSAERHQLQGDTAEFALALLLKVVENVAFLDAAIAKHTENWEMERLAIIDKNILRLSLAELNFFPDIPRKVSIDEAIELAKIYGSSESGRFVNGVLDALSKDI